MIGAWREVLAISYDRMAAIKIRNVIQDNGYSATIQEVTEKDCQDKEGLKVLRKMEQENNLR